MGLLYYCLYPICIQSYVLNHAISHECTCCCVNTYAEAASCCLFRTKCINTATPWEKVRRNPVTSGQHSRGLTTHAAYKVLTQSDTTAQHAGHSHHPGPGHHCLNKVSEEWLVGVMSPWGPNTLRPPNRDTVEDMSRDSLGVLLFEATACT